MCDPCEHNGRCKQDNNGYTCIYFQITRVSDIDECMCDPCEHNGRCKQDINGYTCICLPGFSGLNCEVSKYIGPLHSYPFNYLQE